MRVQDPTELALSEVRQVRDVHELRPFLRSKSSAVVARAAKMAAELEGGGLAPELVEAFRRLMKDAPRLDKGCQALTAIATALAKHDVRAVEIYRAGVRHVQMESSYGLPVDAAAPLRAVCAVGLVRARDPEALFEAVLLLVDEWPEARAGGVRALAESGSAEAELVLRHKALVGDKRAEVTGECLSGLLRLSPKTRSLPFVADFLDSFNPEIAEAAALALGESRITEAFAVLAQAFSRKPEGAILMAMALLRHDEAVAFLLRQLEESVDRTAASALHALAMYQGDPAVRTRVEKAVERRGGVAVRKAWRDHWK